MRLENGTLYEGKFHVVALLRVEPFSVLYHATDTLGRAVWLKILTFDAGTHYSPQLKARYERELRLMAPLRDPHTVRLLVYGQGAHGELYLVFELVQGTPLREVLATRGVLTYDEASVIVSQLLSSLREAHQAGIIHRNVTPDSVFIAHRDDGLHATLADFGVARAVGNEHPSVTATGDLAGTPRYMSPEQVLRQPITAGSDLFAVGLLGYEMMFGSAALPGDSLGAVLERMQRPRPVDVHAPGALGEVLDQMTRNAAASRYPNAGVALDDLRRRTQLQFTGTLPHPAASVLATPNVDATTEAQVGQLAGSSHTKLWGVAVALVVAIAVVAAILTVNVLRRPPAPVEPQPKRELGGLTTVETPPPAPRVTVAKIELPEDKKSRIYSHSLGCKQPGVRPYRGELHYIPKHYDGSEPWPLVIMLTNDYLSAHELLHNSGFIDLANRNNWLLLVADDESAGLGVPGSWKWRDAAMTAKVQAEFDEFSFRHCVDPTRVYVVSHGVGGERAEELACEPWVAAFVSNGYIPRSRTPVCDRQIARLQLHPEDSPHYGRKGGPPCVGAQPLSQEQAMQLWRVRNGCEGKPAITKVDEATCHTWQCETPYTFCGVPGGTLWPPGHVEYAWHVFMSCDGDSEPAMDVTSFVERFLLSVPPLKVDE